MCVCMRGVLRAWCMQGCMGDGCECEFVFNYGV